MRRYRAPYPPEFRQQIVELVRAGRTAEELSREFEPTDTAIRNWVRRADLDEGRRADGLTTLERYSDMGISCPCPSNQSSGKINSRHCARDMRARRISTRLGILLPW